MSWLSSIDPVTAGVVAALAALGLRALALVRAAKDRRAIGDPELLGRMVQPTGPVRRTFAALLTGSGAGLLAAALAAGGFTEEVAGEDGSPFETVLVLDASNSMLAEDVAPSRLRLEQALARRMVGRLAGRVGVVYFAGSGYVLSPLTEDRAATLMFTQAVHPTHVGRGGTSLVDGLEQALVVLAGGRAGATRSIVLLSDGESTVDEPALDVVLERARRAGVTIHAAGVGTAEGGRIPMPPVVTELPGVTPGESGESDEPGVTREPGRGLDQEADTGRRWLRDPSGRVVVTRLEESALRSIAGETGGLYASGPGAADLLLERMPAGEGRAPISSARVNGLLLAAFLLLAVEAYVVRRA
ncbi:MAG: vWA domain-containing protein [Gemmatimonadota bacterium]